MFDLLGYHKKYKDFYGDAPLEDVAKDVFARGGYDKEYPDYDTWKKESGVELHIQEDNRLRNPSFTDKLRDAVGKGSLMQSFLQGAAEGLTTELPSMAGGALEFAGSYLPGDTIQKTGKSIKDWAEEKRLDLYGPEEERTGLNRIVYEGTKMLAPSIIPGGIAGTVARSAKGVGELVKAGKFAEAAKAAETANNIGAGSAAALFGLSQAQQTRDTANKRADELEKQGLFEEAKAVRSSGYGLAPIATGAIEALGEFLGTKYIGKLFGLDEAAAGKIVPKEFAKNLLKTLGVEVGTEMGQSSGEAAVEKYSEIRPNAEPIQEALDVIGPTAFMTLLTGGLAGAANKLKSSDPKERESAQYLENVKLGAMTSMAIHTGLKTGQYEGQPFTPDNALQLIKTGMDEGIFTEEDIDRFKERYPRLGDSLNGVIVENFIEKIDKQIRHDSISALKNDMAESKARRETDVPDFEPEGVIDSEPLQTETEIADLKKSLAEPGAKAEEFKTSEEVQSTIDKYEDELSKKYGEDAVVKAPLSPDAYKKMGVSAPESPLSNDELSRLQQLYATREKFDSADLDTCRKAIVSNSGMEEADVHKALNALQMNVGNGNDIYFTADRLKKWGTSTTSNLKRLYDHFSNDTMADFRISGDPENPTIQGTVYKKEDGRPGEWDKEALQKSERFFNVVAETQSAGPIALKNIGGKTEKTKDQSQLPAPLSQTDAAAKPEVKHYGWMLDKPIRTEPHQGLSSDRKRAIEAAGDTTAFVTKTPNGLAVKRKFGKEFSEEDKQYLNKVVNYHLKEQLRWEGNTGYFEDIDNTEAQSGESSKVADAKAQRRQGKVGDMFSSGEVALTSSGRETTPFPKITTGTDRKASVTLKRIDSWLRENAIAEAKARGDEWNARQFESENPKSIPPASKDSMEEYLFGQQPNVIPSILKPLVSGKMEAEGAKFPKGMTVEEWKRRNPELAKQVESTSVKAAKKNTEAMLRGRIYPDSVTTDSLKGIRAELNANSDKYGTAGELLYSKVVTEVNKRESELKAGILPDADYQPDHIADANKMVEPTEQKPEGKEPWQMTVRELADQPAEWYSGKQYLIPRDKFAEIGILRNYKKRGDDYVSFNYDAGKEAVADKSTIEKMRQDALDSHKVYVERAIKNGLPVPESTMKDYPDLKPAPKAEGKVEAAGPPLPVQEKSGVSPVVEIPVDNIKLSKDVPQFKAEADDKGVVQEIQGKEYRRVPMNAIIVWQRNNGDLEVITGRHRLDLAKRLGEKTIPAQIVKESDGFSVQDALTFDAEQNILDNQGTENDYANYFRNTEIDEKEAKARGLLRGAKASAAWILGKNATDQTFNSFSRTGEINFKQAVAVSKAAPKDERLQAAGRSFTVKNPRATDSEIENFVHALSLVKDVPQQVQGDLFGFDDSAIRTAEVQAKKAAAIIGRLRRDSTNINAAIRGEGKLELSAEGAKEYGIKNPKDKEQLKAARNKILSKIGEWEKWYVNPELVKQLTEGQEETKPAEAAAKPEPKTEKTIKGILTVDDAVAKVVSAEHDQKAGSWDNSATRNYAEGPLRTYLTALAKHPYKSESYFAKFLFRGNKDAAGSIRAAKDKAKKYGLLDAYYDKTGMPFYAMKGTPRPAELYTEARLMELDKKYEGFKNIPDSEWQYHDVAVTPKTEKTDAGDQAVIPGASYSETFSLTNPETEISKPISEQVTPKNEDLFWEKSSEAGYGTTNKIFTEDKAAKARAILKAKLNGTQLNMGLDPEIISAGIDLAGYHIEAGARSFSAYAQKMIADIGENIRPYLKSFYLAVRNYPGFDNKGMNTEAELDEIGEKIVTLEDKKALIQKLQKDDKVYYTKDGEKGIAAGYFRKNNGGYITVVSGGGLTSEVFPDDIVRAERYGKPIDVETEANLAAPAEEKEPSAYGAVADRVVEKLKSNTKFTRNELFFMCKDAFGGTLAEGKFSAKDAYDALEMGVSKYIMSSSAMTNVSPRIAERVVADLKEITGLLPTQSTRTEEMDEFQQFSTPPALAYVANWVANIKKEEFHNEEYIGKHGMKKTRRITDREGDIYLEPSAGTGGIASFAMNPSNRVSEVIVNELASRRADILKELGFDRVFTENAEQINNILPEDVRPTVVVMNPPFSSTAGRMKGERKTINATVHIEQALKRLQPGGRLVAIVGEGMADNRPAFKSWWQKIEGDYTVRANVGISGQEYAKYGTTFDNQIVVIDKPLDQSNKESIIKVTGKVDKIEQLIDLLSGVRNERIDTGKRESVKQGEQKSPSGTEAASGRNESLQPATGGVVAEEQPGRPGRTPDANTGRNEGLGTGKSGAVSGTRSGNTGAGRPSAVEPSGQPKGTGRSNTSDDTRQADNAPSAVPTEAVESLTVEQRAEIEKHSYELSDSVYDTYRPAKVKIPNAKEHPGKLVESAAMASIDPIDPKYSPKLPEAAVKSGKISIAQLEAVVYAGQAHSEMLPNGRRKGFFIGDGTGVGKGREIASILWDNWNQGRRKAVWVSQNSPLMKDAERDIKGIGWDAGLLFDMGKAKLQGGIQQKEGIGFVGYGTLRSKKVIEGREISRLNQLVDWFGKDYDGVIVFDESHNMGNALPVKGQRGTTKPSATALAGVELQKLLPQARIVYVSATGATEVMNLAYAERLGLWGDKTPFPNALSFVTSISAGGISAMEMVAMNMKANGVYMARSLAYDDVKYERLEHPLTTEQRAIYDELASAWQIAQNDINAAMAVTGITGVGHTGDTKTLNTDAKSHIMAQFWGTNQRFWNQVITAMQMPTVIKAIDADLKTGHAPLVQLINTNESAQERAIGRLEEDDSLEDMDITPRDMLIEYVNNSFPVYQFEKYTDDDGNERSRLVVDSQGNPVLNAEAVAMRDDLLMKIGSIRVPDGPLEMILDHFGVDVVSEVTGRSRRVVYKDTPDGRKRVVESWGKNKGMADADAFMADKKKILVFSQAGGTGRSYHADRTAKNKRLRRHYLVQAGWRADVAVQGLGRSHRTNQEQAPEWVLVATDLEGQKRFISSIARRLSQLGALTKGSRETGNQGLFNSRDNLESQEAKDAFHQLLKDLHRNEVPDMTMGEFIEATGLNNIIDKDTGALNVSQLPEITQFLNRILNMKIEQQNHIFGEFSKRLNMKVALAIEDGTLDVGVETIRAKKTEKANEQVVYQDEKTNAQAKYIEVVLTHDAKLMTFQQSAAYSMYGYVQNIKSGRIWALANQRNKTNALTGEIENQYSSVGANYNYHVIAESDIKNPEKYREIPTAQAEALWNADYNAAPKEIKESVHMITGIILPIWDRLPTGQARIYRLNVDGKNIIGRVVNRKDLDVTLRKLGATRKAGAFKPEDIFNNVLNRGYAYTLSNDWTIGRRKVADDYRIEIKGPSYSNLDELRKYGIFTERISYETRFFIPTDTEAGTTAIREIISSRPVVDEVAAGKKAGDVTAKDAAFMNEAGKFKIVHHGTPHIWQPEPGFPHGRPRLDKIGTGEGAAAYGWGWYSAEAEEVGTGYRRATTDTLRIATDIVLREAPLLEGVSFDAIRAIREAGNMLKMGMLTREKAGEHAFNISSELRREIPARMRLNVSETKDLLGYLAKQYSKADIDGSLYKLDIPDDVMDKLLDWDNPLSQQSEEIQSAFIEAMKQKALPELGNPELDDTRFNLKETVTGAYLYHSLTSKFGSQKAASEYLASIGIPGNKYLDQMSRGVAIWSVVKTGAWLDNNFAIRKPGKSPDDAIVEAMPSREAAIAEAKKRNDALQSYNFVVWDQKVLDRIALLERNGEKLDAIREAQYAIKEGEQNEQRQAAEHTGEGRGRDSLLSPDAQRHEQKVDIQRSIILQDDRAPVRLREECQKGQGIVHAPEGYADPEFLEIKDAVASYGIDLIPIRDTSNNINGMIKGTDLFLNMKRGDMTLTQVAFHELSHFIGNKETQSKIDTTSHAFQKYKRQLSKDYFNSAFRALPDSHVLEEYAADLEGGVTSSYGVKLADGLKKGEKVTTLADKQFVKTGASLYNDIRFMTAWHGSPYDFDKFSKDKIGTGEGAQAYGYGLYFAGKREVAEFYKKSTTRGANAILTFDGKEIKFPKYESDLKLIFNDNYTKQELRDIIGNAILDAEHFERKDDANKLREILEAFNVAKNIKLERGRLYQVELAPDDDEYLLWDKPLSEQSEKVKEALDRAIDILDPTVRKRIIDEQNKASGAFIYKNLSIDIGEMKEQGWAGINDEKKASDYLHSLGIRGIKYLDGSSRSKGEGNYNYVIFSDEDVDIKEKYSIRTPQDPPTSKDPKVLNLYLKDEADALVKTIMDKLQPKRMTWLETMLKSPEWFSNTQLKNIVRLFMRDRNEIYHETFNELNAADDIDAPESTVTEAAKALKKKSPKEYQRLQEIIDEGDTSWKRDTSKSLSEQLKDFEDHIKKQSGTTDEVLRVWKLYRQSYDKALDIQTAQLRQMIAEIIEEANFRGETPDLNELKQTLKGALAQMEEWRGFYAPRVREAGNWKVQAYKEHGPMKENREWYREHRTSQWDAERLANKLKREGWTIYNVGEVERIPETIYQDVNAVATAKLIDAALEKISQKSALTEEMTLKFNEEVLRSVSDAIKTRGFRSTMIHRGRGVVRGFIEDPIERHLHYINGLSAGIAKARVARLAMKELLGEKFQGKQIGGLDPVKNPKEFDVAESYIQEQLRNADATDRIVGLAKSIATFKFLGFNVRSLAVNMTAIMTTAPAAIHQYATGGKGSFFKIMKELASAGADYGAVMAGRRPLTADERSFIDEVHKKGWDDAQYTREALGEISKLHNKAWSTVMDVSMKLFGVSEKWNRGTTMLAAYRLARKQGMNHLQAAEAAKESSDRAHGVYGKSTMPMWAQGTNPAAKIGQMMYIYSKFSHNYLQMLYDMGFRKKNIKGAMYAFLSPLVLAGGAALPFKDAIFAFAGLVLRSIFGEDKDPEKWVWDVIRKHLGDDAERIGRHGLTGAAGVDISGSLSIGVGIPKDFIELTGAIGGVATEGKEAIENIGRGQYGRAAEHLLPTGLANPIRAAREASQGVSTRNNRRVWDEKGKPYVPSTAETAARTLGFRSTKQAVLSERTWEASREQSDFTNKRNEIYERYRAWLLGKRDREEYKEIVQAVQDYNRKASEIPGASMITSEFLRNQAKRMQHPNKKERALLQ